MMLERYLFSACLRIISASITVGVLAISSNAEPIKSPSSHDHKMWFFAPFDAPYLTSGYQDRLRDLLSSISLDGDRSELDTSPMAVYRSNVTGAKYSDYSLSKPGRAVLNEARSWLLVGETQLSEGYQQYRNLYVNIANAQSKNDFELFRTGMIDLFSTVPVHKYVNAEQAARVLLSNPLKNRFRAVENLTDLQVDEYLFFPLPEDLIEQHNDQNFVPLEIKTSGNDGAVLGEAAVVDVILPSEDRILEKLAHWPSEKPAFLPEKLIFARNLRFLDKSEKKPVLPDTAMYLDMPAGLFELYSSAATGQPSLILIAVRLGARG